MVAVSRRFDDGADDGIQARGIAASGQHPDFHETFQKSVPESVMDVSMA
jgi:hypothetical protein